MQLLPVLSELEEIVIQTAKEELLPRFIKVDHSQKADGSLLTEADFAVQNRLQRELQRKWPGYAFLGEEMDETEQQRLIGDQQQPLWCLDPLDGTRNFVAGLPFFSTSLALLHQGKVILGVVYDPIRDECFSVYKGKGATLNGTPLGQHHPQGPLAKGIGIVDFKRLPSELAARLVCDAPYSSQRSLGSVALDWCWVAAGRCHAYLHGNQKLWDFAAGQLILEETGGYSCTLTGEPVFNATLEPRSAVAALDKSLFLEWTQWLDITPTPLAT